MNRAEEPVQKPGEPVENEYDLASEETVSPELFRLRNWLPAATPTDGQPYVKTRRQRQTPPPPPRRTYPFGIDSRSSEL